MWIPYPYGGKQRQVQVDLDTNALQSKGFAGGRGECDQRAKYRTPSGTSKIGTFEYAVDTNSSPTDVAELNQLPIKTVGRQLFHIHDVAYVATVFRRRLHRAVNGQRPYC